jgi:hypothetical protein
MEYHENNLEKELKLRTEKNKRNYFDDKFLL